MSRFAPPLIVLATLALAGCGGGGGGGGGGAPATGTLAPPATSPAPGSPTHTLARYFTASFDEAAATAARNAPEFAIQDKIVTLSAGGPTLPTFAYAAIRAEYAHSVGLTGRGTTIAVVDDGFRLGHRELAGKTITTYGSVPVESHGTAVASIAAGVSDGQGVMGIAPGADLHLSSFTNGVGAIAGATRDADARGALVQNNSWGYSATIDRLESWLAANPGASAADGFAAIVGAPRADAAAYLDALRAFTTDGIVVFAASNADGATRAGLMDGLPVVVPELTPGWLVAVNAVLAFDAQRVTGARRLSAPCNDMAPSCLVADGTVRAAAGGSDTDYALVTGSSFAAPQVAGAVALLAQAFPDLPAADLRVRLLASADNGFFPHAGATDFGNGVRHGYGTEFGHGALDLRAALLPIGQVGLPATANAYEGVAGPSTVAAGDAYGDAVARALASERIAVFDSLGATFSAPGAILVGAAPDADFSRRMRAFSGATPELARAQIGGSAGADGEDAIGWHFASGAPEAVQASIGLTGATSPVLSAPGGLAGLTRNGFGFAATRELRGGGAITVHAFGDAAPEPEGAFAALSQDRVGPAWGAGVARHLDLGPGAVTLGISTLHETDGVLGLRTTGVLGTTRSTAGALDLGLSLPIGTAALDFSAQLGMTDAVGGGLAAGYDGVAFSAFGATLGLVDVLRDGDRLALSVRQPMRVEQGTALLRVPAGRDREGRIAFRDLAVDLAPRARQIDLGLDWTTGLGPRSELRLGAALSLSEGHQPGATGAAMMGAFRHSF
ncbi:MAG: S8 family peptidase [Salinarimonas sp.]